MAQKATVKRKTYILVLVAVFLALAALLAVIYCILAQNYKNRFPDNTYINEIDVSGMNAARAKKAVADAAESYSLTIVGRDGETYTLSGQKLDLTYVDNGEIDALLESYNPYAWFLNNRRTDYLTAYEDTTYDSATAKASIHALGCFTDYTPTSDAQIVDDGQSFVVQPEVEGTEMDWDAAEAAILSAINDGITVLDLESEDLYLNPSVFSNDAGLQAEADRLNSYLSADITYDFGDYRIVSVGAKEIRELISEDETGTLDLDYTKVYNFVRDNMAYAYDTFGLSRTFTTHSGAKILLSGGDYGWCLAREDTATALYDAILDGYVGELEPCWQYSAKHLGEDDTGGTYVEVSISEQMMWCYEDYRLVVETPVVTGNISKGNGTPYGSVWAIDGKKQDATLGTLDTMGYSSPVSYWMPFTGNVGIHDADGWRTEYGGNIYLTSGSHGCVNTPLEACEQIFNIVEVGSPVFVYDLSAEDTEIISQAGERQEVASDADWDWDD